MARPSLCLRSTESIVAFLKYLYSQIDGMLKDNRGTAAVEFALLSPLYILLLMGLIAYGVYLGAAHSVEQIAADAARVAVAGLSHAERQALVTRFIADHSAGYAFVDPAKISIDFNNDAAATNYFVVRISYDARDLPIWQLATNLPLPATTISRQSVVRVGGV
jgi:Flp pilus assembly protein TadG